MSINALYNMPSSFGSSIIASQFFGWLHPSIFSWTTQVRFPNELLKIWLLRFFLSTVITYIKFKRKILTWTGVRTRNSRSLVWRSAIELSWFLFQNIFKLSSWNVCHFYKTVWSMTLHAIYWSLSELVINRWQVVSLVIQSCRSGSHFKRRVWRWIGINAEKSLSRPFLISILLPFWRAVRSYRPHLEERDPIWGDDWSHTPFIRRSPSWASWGFLLDVAAL